MNVPTLCLTQLNNNGNPWPFNDPVTEKFDCNIAKTAEAVFYFNGDKLTADQVRQMGNRVGPRPSGNGTTDKVFQKEGMVKGTDYELANPRPFTDLKDALYAGWYVGLYVDYGYLNRVGALTGDRKYTGLHCVGLWGWRRSTTGILVWEHDPLFDGRRAVIPMGRQHVVLAPLRKAAESAVVRQKLATDGTNLWSGWAVKIPL